MCCRVNETAEAPAVRSLRGMTIATQVLSTVALCLAIPALAVGRVYAPFASTPGGDASLGMSFSPFALMWLCGKAGVTLCVPVPGGLLQPLLNQLNDYDSSAASSPLLSSFVASFDSVINNQYGIGGAAAVTLLCCFILSVTACGTLAYYSCNCCCGCCKPGPSKLECAAPGPIVLLIFSAIAVITSAYDLGTTRKVFTTINDPVAAQYGVTDTGLTYASGAALTAVVLALTLIVFILSAVSVIMHVCKRGQGPVDGTSVGVVTVVKANPTAGTISTINILPANL